MGWSHVGGALSTGPACPRSPGRLHPHLGGALQPTTLRRLLLDAGFNLVGVEGQNGALVRDLPLAGRFARGHTSTPYRVAERFLPTLLGSQVGAFAVRL